MRWILRAYFFEVSADGELGKGDPSACLLGEHDDERLPRSYAGMICADEWEPFFLLVVEESDDAFGAVLFGGDVG